MDLPRVQIKQQFARINLDIKPYKFELKHNLPALQISQPAGELQIDQLHVKVKVDAYPAFYDLGYKNPADLSRDAVRNGRETALKGIARYAKEGDRMMSIERERNIIPLLAKEAAAEEYKELNIKWKRGPETRVEPPQLEVNYVTLKTRPGSVLSEFKWGEVNIKLIQKGQLEVSLTGEHFDYLV